MVRYLRYMFWAALVTGHVMAVPSFAADAATKSKIAALASTELQNPTVIAALVKETCGIKKIGNMIKYETCKTSLETAIRSELKSRGGK
ncbi:MAG: hypothetical protein QM537_09395 [Candidatus Symbiobacter sp.]|nr:hypothetical protein [Candidatus Symbiobacter sp.]